MAFNGKVSAPFGYTIGSPYTNRPEKLGFYAKYLPIGIDTGMAECKLYIRRTNGNRNVIAKGQVFIYASGVYNYHQISLNYLLPDFPDSAAISFKPCNLDSNARRVGSSLFIDDVAFTGAVGINEFEGSSSEIKIYPNPANNVLTFETLNKNADRVELVNVFGNVIESYKICEIKTTINVTSYLPGYYFYRVLDIANRVVGSGKINLIK